MAAVGRLAGSIAHEVNNPLEAILNLSYLLSVHPSLDEQARVYANMLLNEVVRVGDITRRTLSFYRDTTDPVEIDMISLMEGLLKLHEPIMERHSIHLDTRFNRPVSVLARAGELRQVFTNLIGNAIDALPQGGRIAVSVCCGPNGNGSCVSIADNGQGIPRELRNKIFEPFVSTKRTKGTGLGLWISQGIVRKYGGHIRLRTWTAPSSKTGTVFRVCIPGPS
jgi:signal transduction histidine kinase